jgi:ABC-type transport system involved in multi-copper enzyme maturation permease subunit
MFWSGPVRRNYTIADFDRRLNYEQTITYELPGGRGHRYFNSGIGSYVLGGWKTSAIISALSGLPFTISTGSATGGTTQTVNQIAPFQVTHSVSGAANTAWFNPASFAAPPACAVYSAINSVGPATSRTTSRSSKAFPSSASPLSNSAWMPST